MIELDQNLLAKSPEETARRLCLGLLEKADEALSRLARDEDPEALHDFRVAVRRLRSVIRAYKPYLKGSARKKLRARLSELAESTNAPRDHEVQMEWLTERAPELEPEAAEGARHLEERLESRGDGAPRPEELRAKFDPLRAAFQKSLARVKLQLELDNGPSFLSATGKLIGETATRLKESFRTVRSPEDGERLHRARIEAKRLRYLLEPISAEVPEARSLVREMKSLQDVLGELQDMRVMSSSIAAELERAAIEEAQRLGELALREGTIDLSAAPPHGGLLALLRAQRERRDRQFAALSKRWLSGSGDPFFERVQKLARELEALSEPPKPRRRFLLAVVPGKAKRRPVSIVRQAFLPGKKIHERAESIQTGERARFSRVAESNGAHAEERISKETFERFWTLAPLRVERNRYRVRENGRTFWIDEVRDRGVVLAEVDDEKDGELPDWLNAVVKEDVTGLPKYEGETLARGRARQRSSLGSSKA
ncbi:MAG TPA: CHAD domain-containing protein [Vicinamibacteria bacterium]|nr:CHAD domain-containing protein [Vicinamibacteria bacterium]